MDSIQPGQIVKAKPVGQTRTQTFQVERVDGELVHGYLVSRKYPGDFRGRVTAWLSDTTPA